MPVGERLRRGEHKVPLGAFDEDHEDAPFEEATLQEGLELDPACTALFAGRLRVERYGRGPRLSGTPGQDSGKRQERDESTHR